MAGSVRQLLIAAHVAPTAAIASAVRHVADDAELQERLRAEPDLIPPAVEELLRLYTPNQGFARTARRDTEVRGLPGRSAGEQVALVLTAANRDPAVFDEPDEFRLDRADAAPRVRSRPAQVPRRARRARGAGDRPGGAARTHGTLRGRRTGGDGPVAALRAVAAAAPMYQVA